MLVSLSFNGVEPGDWDRSWASLGIAWKRDPRLTSPQTIWGVSSAEDAANSALVAAPF
jgi:hypothetical protein